MAIKNFGWNFVGWMDHDDAGFAGTPVDDRRYTKEALYEPYRAVEKMAILMDELGYDALYTAEHHFQPEGIEVFSNPVMLSLHLASITKSLRIGHAYNILPQWHPVRLAEDYAFADYVTRGRIIFGVARGSQTRELESFGAPMLDQDANRDMFEEQVEIIMKAFHQERWSHKGERYTIPPALPYRTTILEEVTVHPRPLYSTDIWQPVTSGKPRGINFMATHGIKGIFIPAMPRDADGVPGPASFTTDLVRVYQEAAAAVGRNLEFGEDMGAYLFCHIGDSREQAAREIEIYEEESFKRLTGVGGGPVDAGTKEILWKSGFQGFTMDQLQRLGDPKTAAETAAEMGYESLEERSAKDAAFLFGPPDHRQPQAA
jgi:alkanesulfonate monooxygenase SsuD/methylene tetrahydromethanopterin reductase-like flavin-dependent oxidoreductase (luciferase family)